MNKSYTVAALIDRDKVLALNDSKSVECWVKRVWWLLSNLWTSCCSASHVTGQEALSLRGALTGRQSTVFPWHHHHYFPLLGLQMSCLTPSSQDTPNWNSPEVNGDALDVIFYCHMTTVLIALSTAPINIFRQEKELDHYLCHHAASGWHVQSNLSPFYFTNRADMFKRSFIVIVHIQENPNRWQKYHSGSINLIQIWPTSAYCRCFILVSVYMSANK